MPPAITGISEHNGWAELVTVGLQDGQARALDRRRVTLVDPDLPQNPYHHEGLVLPLAETQVLVDRVQASVARRCRAALRELQALHGIAGVVLQESPYPALPPTLAEVLASYTLTCAADGMMYRERLAAAARDLGLQVQRLPRKADRLAAAARVLGVDRAALGAQLAAMGATLGPPWRKEHQEAAASALAMLAGRR